jgi:hypothetical protein
LPAASCMPASSSKARIQSLVCVGIFNSCFLCLIS